MKKIALCFGAAALALFVVGCGQQQSPANTHDADILTIQGIEKNWNEDWGSKDADKLAAHYADDAVLMAPGMAAVSGKEAIRKALAEMVADPKLSLQFQASKVEVSGDLGFTQGSYTYTATDSTTRKPVNDHGSYVTTYRRGTDGAWKAVADIASSELPPAPAPAGPAKK